MATSLEQPLMPPHIVEMARRKYDELRLKAFDFGEAVGDQMVITAYHEGEDDALWLALLPYAYSREAEFVYANAMYVGMSLTLENIGEMAKLQPRLNLIIRARDLLREMVEINLRIEAGTQAS